MREAEPEIVGLYKYVYKAGRPVTFEEIVEKALPPGMRSAAYNAYIEHAKADGEYLPDQYWEDEGNKERAWRWWITGLVNLSRINKRLSATAEDGGGVSGRRRESLLYSPGPRPPYVRYQDGKVRPWTSELDREYERAVAGQRYVQRTDAYKARLAEVRTKPLTDKELKDLLLHLDDGYKALKVVRSRP